MDNKRNSRADLAQETLRIIRDGGYASADGAAVNIAEDVARSREGSVFLPSTAAARLEQDFRAKGGAGLIELRNESTLSAILRLSGQETTPFGVLNFASAKNPGGGFLNGALAQEESLAAASSLYDAQLALPEYYETNRACKSMVYTDSAIWSPDVVFFRGDDGILLRHPAKASVLTLPAVNYGQVLLKGEDEESARAAMKRRMKTALAVFAEQGCDAVVLGAYGCGVFRNDPDDVARWWDGLLREYGGHFRRVVFAVLDRSGTGAALSAFRRVFCKTPLPFAEDTHYQSSFLMDDSLDSGAESVKIDRDYLVDESRFTESDYNKLGEIYKQLPNYVGVRGVAHWFGFDDSEYSLCASFEPAGLQFAGCLKRSDWEWWEREFHALLETADFPYLYFFQIIPPCSVDFFLIHNNLHF